MEEYEDNVPDENIQITSPKKCNFILKDMNMFTKPEKKNKYNNRENENNESEKIKASIKEPILISNNITKDSNSLKESKESNSCIKNKFQNRKISETPKFSESKIVNINLNNLYKENTKLLKKTKNKIIPKNNKKKQIKYRNNNIKKVNYEQINLTQRPKIKDINKIFIENKSHCLNKDLLDAHIKNLKAESSKNQKQLFFDKKAAKKSLSNKKQKLDISTKKTSFKSNNLSKRAIPKEIKVTKTQNKLKEIHSNNYNNISNGTILKEYTYDKNDSKGSSVKLKKKLNMKLEKNKKFLNDKGNKNNKMHNNSISVLINYKNLTKVKSPHKSKIIHMNLTHNNTKKELSSFIIGFKIFIKVWRKKLKYFFMKLRKFKRNININKEYKITSPIKNIIKKNLNPYGTNRKLHKYNNKNNSNRQSIKREKKIKNINNEFKKEYFSSYKKNNGNNLFLLYPYNNINNFNINTIQINLFNEDLLYRISKNVNNKNLINIH